MDTMWSFMAGGAALGIIAGLWGRIKDYAWRFVSLFIQQVEISTDCAHNAVVAHLIAHYRRSRMYDRMYGAWYEHQRDGRYGLVSYEVYGARSVVFWKGMIPFLFSNAVENKAKTSTGGQNQTAEHAGGTKIFSTITFLRGTLDLEAILNAACLQSNQLSWQAESSDEQRKNRFVIHYVPKRETENEDWGHTSNGLAWYQQGM